MKKSHLIIAGMLSIGLLGGSTATEASAKVIKWHKGVPKLIDGKRFRSKRMSGNGFNYTAIWAKKNIFHWRSPHNEAKYTSTYYIKQGKTYLVRTWSAKLPPANYKIRYVNKKTIKFQFPYGKNWEYLHRF